MSASRAWQGIRHLLAVRLDNLGDLLMTTPALRALRQRWPGCRITLLASAAGAAAQPYVPEIDAAMVMACPWAAGPAAQPGDCTETVTALRTQRPDAAVIFTVFSQNPLPAALLCWLAGIPRVLAHCRENPYQLLSDWVPDPEPHALVRHEVRRQLELVAQVGAHTDDERLSFHVPETEARRAMEILRQAGIDTARRWIVLHPGASAPVRRYPEELFAEAVRLLDDTPGLQMLFTGEASEALRIEAIRARLRRPLPTLAGRLGLGELAAVIRGAALLVANNSGPVHIAAAVGTPVVDIYALTNPQHAPWQVPHRVLFHDVPCRFCYRSTCPQGHHDCLRLLDPQRVADAAQALLQEGADHWPPTRIA